VALDDATVELLVRRLIAYDAAGVAAALVEARTSDPVIESVRLFCLHQGQEIPLGPGQGPGGAGAGLTPALALGLVPTGQDVVVEVQARLAAQVLVRVPGAVDWRPCRGSGPWRVSFVAAPPGGVVEVVAKNAANSAGVWARTAPLRVIPDIDLSALRLPQWPVAAIRQLAEAVSWNKPREEFRPDEFAAHVGSIDHATRAVLAVGAGQLAIVESALSQAFKSSPAPPGKPPEDLRLPKLPQTPAWPMFEFPQPVMAAKPAELASPAPWGVQEMGGTP
jgi:hypothetical protein